MMTAKQVLEREFLEMRARILDLAASLDRLERTDGAEAIDDEPAYQRLCEALNILTDTNSGKAERIQLLFSRDYDADWKQKFELSRS